MYTTKQSRGKHHDKSLKKTAKNNNKNSHNYSPFFTSYAKCNCFIPNNDLKASYIGKVI